MATITKQFDMAFYKKVYEAIDMQSGDIECDGGSEYGIHIEVDGYGIDLTATFHVRWQDDSFDHAFGTQHYEPYPVIENLTGIDGVTVTDEDDNEVEGFDTAAFWALFEQDNMDNLHKGDRVTVERYCKPKTQGTFMSYNRVKGVAKIILEDGSTIEADTSETKIRKANKAA